MKVSKKGVDFIKSWESFVPFLYDDLRYNKKLKYGYAEWTGGPISGTLTIGYGHTKDAKAKIDMVQGMRITEVQAASILDEDLDEIEAWINNNVRATLTQGMFDALVSFGFNCGIGNLKKLIRPLQSGDYEGTKAKFSEFTRSKGQVLNGLVKRRAGEQKLWSSEEAHLPAEMEETPKNVTKVAPPATSTEKITGAVASVTPVVAALQDWKVAAVIFGFILIGGGLYLWYRNR